MDKKFTNFDGWEKTWIKTQTSIVRKNSVKTWMKTQTSIIKYMEEKFTEKKPTVREDFLLTKNLENFLQI